MNIINKQLYLDFGKNVDNAARKAEKSISREMPSPNQRLNVAFEIFLNASIDYAGAYDPDLVHRLFVAHLEGLEGHLAKAKRGH